MKRFVNLILSKSELSAVSEAAISCSVCDCKWAAVPSLTCWWSCSRMRRKLPAPQVRPPAPEAGPVSASNLTRAGRRAARSTRRPSAARLIYFSPVFSYVARLHWCMPAHSAQSKLTAQSEMKARAFSHRKYIVLPTCILSKVIVKGLFLSLPVVNWSYIKIRKERQLKVFSRFRERSIIS